jgi:hypothetical protein
VPPVHAKNLLGSFGYVRERSWGSRIVVAARYRRINFAGPRVRLRNVAVAAAGLPPVIVHRLTFESLQELTIGFYMKLPVM